MSIQTPKILRFAAVGACISFILAAAGYRIDLAVPSISLNQQLFYNWLTLFLSPISFFLRLRAPDSPIAPSFLFVIGTAACNSLWYGFIGWCYLNLRSALSGSIPLTISVVAGGTTSASTSAVSRRTSPQERLAERYEHRLSVKE
jgi:hypothetical protein